MSQTPTPFHRGSLLLESKRLSVSIRPEDGGRVVDLRDRASDFPLVWINPNTIDIFRPYQCNYDDLGNSGVEEAFPTVPPCKWGKSELPYFGEVWNLPWQVEETDASHATLSRCCPVTTGKLTKTFRFDEDGATLVTDYTIQNIGREPMPYVFGVHPTLTMLADSHMYAPHERYTLYLSRPQKFEGTPELQWPSFEGLDFSKAMPPESLGCYNIVSMPTKGTRYGVFHPSKGLGLEVAFDPEMFPCLSLWPIYGGFRGHTCLMSEIFSSWPAGLDEAVKAGLQRTLAPGESDHTTVCYRLIHKLPEEETQA